MQQKDLWITTTVLLFIMSFQFMILVESQEIKIGNERRGIIMQAKNILHCNSTFFHTF